MWRNGGSGHQWRGILILDVPVTNLHGFYGLHQLLLLLLRQSPQCLFHVVHGGVLRKKCDETCRNGGRMAQAVD